MNNFSLKSIYDISIGQLITVWILCILIWLVPFNVVHNAIWNYGYQDFLANIGRLFNTEYFLFLFIPAILIFYTIGWRNNRKALG